MIRWYNVRYNAKIKTDQAKRGTLLEHKSRKINLATTLNLVEMQE